MQQFSDKGECANPCSRYKRPSDLPDIMPVFPLGGALLLPRGQLPLNIFEPRYLAMVDAALSGSRLVGMLQPSSEADLALQDDPAARPELYRVGCAGRITAYSECDDGRILITLTGICRFRTVEEVTSGEPYRSFRVDALDYAEDFHAGAGQADVDRARLLEVFRNYLDAHELEADWESVHESSNEALVNALAMISPYGPKEKQAMLEAPDLHTRNEILIALTEMALAQQDGDSPTSGKLQ